MRILITGGFGFVGGRMAVHLAQAGHSIVLGSREQKNAPPWLPQAEVKKIVWDDIVGLESSCTNVDVVIHAAGMNARECAANPIAAIEMNGVATARLVAAACSATVTRFIYLSTAHVYANPLVGYITEETCPRNLHPYATSHLVGEYALLNASQLGEIQGIVLRLSNAFGAPVDKAVNCWMLLINDLCRQAVQSRKLILQTSGLQYRDFISMHEICRFTDYAIGISIESLKRSVFNLGSGNSITVLQMAQLIQERCVHVLGFKPILEYSKKSGNDNSKKLKYNINRMKQSGYNPENLDAAEIDKLLKYCQSNFS